ncbi:MAG TPA: FecR domain-containing protein, partial [Kofleriaceae bacterium]|nr:FecR domain-containing protein [Kofleriaceae bacterium]
MLRGKIAVEPLDEDRVTHIERRIVAGAAEAAARGRQRAWLRGHAGRAMMAVALVAAGVIGWLLHAAPAAPVAMPMAMPMAMMDPPAIRVDSRPGRAVLDIGDARIESDPSTVFAVTRPAGGVVVALERGKVELEVAKRGDRPPLVVRAGDTDVIVVGTHFTVDYGDGHGEVDVRVTEGVVRVVHARKETRVAAGEAWHTHDPQTTASAA